jgi:amino acid transporter
MYLIGPGGAVIAYLLMGSLICSGNASLAEMSAVFPRLGKNSLISGINKY